MKTKVLTTDEEIRIFTDPFRMKILTIFKESEQPLTASQVAEKLGVHPSKVHYHAKKLIAIDAIELDHTESINGIQAKYYKVSDMRLRVDYASNAGDDGEVSSAVSDMLVGMLKQQQNLINQAMMGQKDHDPKRRGFMTQTAVYLTASQLTDLEKQMTDLVTEYAQCKDDGEDKYTILVSLVRDPQ